MSVRIGSGALRERFQQQRMIFLGCETSDANKKNVVVAEAFLGSPFTPRALRARITVRWNAVRNHPALLYRVKLLQAVRHFFRNGHRNYSVVERIALNASRSRLDLAFC